jgi:hypothetical protein
MATPRELASPPPNPRIDAFVEGHPVSKSILVAEDEQVLRGRWVELLTDRDT